MAKIGRLIIALTSAVLCACASSPPAPQTPAKTMGDYEYVKNKLTWLIAEEMRDKRISGLSIALVNGDDVVWQQGFGVADKRSKLAVTPSTRFRAGSLIKPLNAIALLKLEESGKLDILAPIQRYLAEFSPPRRAHQATAEPITIAHCLTHLSGLPSNLIKGMWAQEPDDFMSSLAYLNNSYPPQAPDTVFRYSNLAHNVLGAVIEKQSGEAYESHMEGLFTALGMQHSELQATPRDLAKAYDKGREVKVFGLRDVPAAGLVSSAEDLANLLMFFNRVAYAEQDQPSLTQSSSLLSTASWDKMQRDYSGHLPLNLGKRHGLGLIFYDGLFHPSLRVYGHGGASVNHRALIKFIPQSGLGVALLSNAKNSGASLHKIANQALTLLLEAKRGRPAPRAAARWPQVEQGDIIDPEKMLGHYATAAGMAKVVKKGEDYYVSIAGRKLKLYQRQQDGLFYLQYRLFGLWSVDIGYFSRLAFALRSINGQAYLVSKTTHGTQKLVGPKLSPVPIPQAWRQRVGKYRIVKPLEAIAVPSGGIKIEDGFLTAHATVNKGDKMQVVLLPINDDDAIVAGLESGFGEVVSAGITDGKARLHFSGIVFEKR